MIEKNEMMNSVLWAFFILTRHYPIPSLGKLIHLTFRKNTTTFSSNNPSTPHRIKVSEQEVPLSQRSCKPSKLHIL